MVPLDAPVVISLGLFDCGPIPRAIVTLLLRVLVLGVVLRFRKIFGGDLVICCWPGGPRDSMVELWSSSSSQALSLVDMYVKGLYFMVTFVRQIWKRDEEDEV